jgi:hypothetical protein
MHSRTKPNAPNPLNESGSRPVTRPLMRRAIRGPQGGALRPHPCVFLQLPRKFLGQQFLD